MGSISERSTSSSSSSSKKIDPLLRDLNDKKQIFRRNVVSLAAELKEVRAHLALQQQSVAKETQKRQEAEANAKGMEEKVVNLHRILEEKDKELQGYSSSAEKYVKELDDLRTQLRVTKSTAEASAASAQSAEMKCLALVKDLDDKNNSIKDHEDLVKNLAEQLVELQKDLQARESSQKQLKDEVLRVERDIMEAMAKAGENKDCELRKILDDVSPKNIEKMNRLLSAKDEEISKLRDEIRILSAQWKLKTKELQNQLEKHRKADQELKKRVLKLEFCLQEARSQTRKLLRMGERGDKAIKELQEELATMQHQSATASGEKHNFWGSSHFKIIASSMSMLILVMFTKR